MSFLKSLSQPFETAIVVVAAFGLFIYSSTTMLGSSVLPVASAADYHRVVVFEIVIGTALLAFLFVRGWRLPDFGFVQFKLMDIVHAGALAVTAIVSYAAIWALLSTSAPNQAENLLQGAGIGVGLAVALAIVNSLFEELFVCAYLIAAWRRGPTHLIILASACLRLSYHLYQGPTASVALIPLAVAFAWYFCRWGRIAPLVLAHVALDLLAIAPHLASDS